MGGFPWYEKKENNSTKQIFEIPDNIDNISETLLNQAIKFKDSGKLFKITKQELDFYKKFGLPIPKKHPDYRHLDRFNSKPKRNLHLISCYKCNKNISSVFETNYNVYCNECYNKEVY